MITVFITQTSEGGASALRPGSNNCRGTDADNIKIVASTPAYSVKGYDNSTVDRAKSNAN